LINPHATEAIVGGIIVNGPNTQLAGFIKPPKIDPIKVAVPPNMGPKIIPESGATITPIDMTPDNPRGIVNGIMAAAVCIAANSAVKAMFIDWLLYVDIVRSTFFWKEKNSKKYINLLYLNTFICSLLQYIKTDPFSFACEVSM